MTSLHHLLEDVGCFAHVVAYHKESGLDVVLVEQIEHKWRHLRNRTIVECEVNRLWDCGQYQKA